MSRMASDHTSLARGSYSRSCVSGQDTHLTFFTHLHLLWAGVVKGTSGALDPTALRAELAEAEIDQNGSTAVIDENVRSLEVFVADTQKVEAVDGVTQPTEEGYEFRPSPWCANARCGLVVQCQENVSTVSACNHRRHSRPSTFDDDTL